MKHQINIFVCALVICITSCHTHHVGDQQLFIENNPGLSPEFWDGWTVVLHPDNGYRWIEYGNEMQRIYVIRKGRQVWVKYYSDGFWDKKSLSELPLTNGDNKIVTESEFRSRVEWLLTNDIVFLNGDSTCLKIQSRDFSIQLVKDGDRIDWQNWNGCWSR